MTGHWIAFGILLLIIPIGFGWFGVKYIKKYNLNEQQKKKHASLGWEINIVVLAL